MMTPLQNEQRSQGGTNRAKNQDPGERKFLAMLAASRRPLLHDANMTPEQILKAFRELAESHPWLYLFVVSADRRTIVHRLSDDAILRRLKEADAIGFLGVITLGTRIQLYSKPLKRGTKVIEDLDRVGREIMAEILEKLPSAKLPSIG